MKQYAIPLLLAALATLSNSVAVAADAPAPAAATGASAPASQAPAPHALPGSFAVVNGTTISAAEFDQAARTGFRQKFYHGQPPEAEINRMLRETGQSLIDGILMNQEVDKRQISPDKAAVDAELASYEARYASSASWKEQRERTLPQLRAFLEQKSKLKVLEETIRKSAKTTTDEVRRYYDEHPEAFTEPEKVRVSTILLKVDPSSPGEVWKQARDEAEKVRARLDGGADFAETARLQSGDASSAAAGGDLGYVHRGMLGDEVHAALDKVQPGQIVGPVRLLQGVALFKLIDRKSPQLQPFEKVAARAEGLLLREKSEKVWKDFLVSIRQAALIAIDPTFAPVMQPEPEAAKKD